MAKETGLGWTTLTVDSSAGNDNLDIRNDILSLSFATPRAVWEITGIDRSAVERLLLIADFSIELKGAFNDAASHAHVVFKTVPSTNVNRTVAINVSGQTLSNECLFTDYTLERPESGELNWTAPGVLADGTVPTWS